MDKELSDRIELVTEAARISFDKAAQYDNTVVGLGYVAFFALWAGVDHDLPRWAALGSASLIGCSLICYVVWNIVQMLMRHRGAGETLKLLSETDIFSDQFLKRWNAAQARTNRASATTMRLWIPIFYLSMATGVLGGLLLSAVAGWMAIVHL